MRISDWSSDVCSSDLIKKVYLINQDYSFGQGVRKVATEMIKAKRPDIQIVGDELHPVAKITDFSPYIAKIKASGADSVRSEEHTSELQSLMRISYAVFCLKKKKTHSQIAQNYI